MSNKQIEASNIVLKENKEIYIDAVCGAGKTELVFASIENALSLGQRVGFIVPRREVVKEIYERLKIVFPSLNITLVYGGHNEYLDGDIICLTAHQCYKYPNKFGLVILDEYDAFPLKGDAVLLSLIKKTSYQKIIYMSATFSKEFLNNKNFVSINRRHHNFDLPVPQLKILPKFLYIFELCKFIHKNKNSSVFIFVSSIKEATLVHILLIISFIKNTVFTSKSLNKDLIFSQIKSKERKIIVCTTILERGITVENLNVVVYGANNKIFDTQTLIQICGRVGRKSSCPTGKILLLSDKINKSIKECITSIYDKNISN